MFPIDTTLGRRVVIPCLALMLGACSTPQEGPGIASPVAVTPSETTPRLHPELRCEEPPPAGVCTDVEFQDLLRIPQKIEDVPAVAGGSVGMGDGCQNFLVDRFQANFFKPWTSTAPIYDPRESKTFMVEEATATWKGLNKRRVPRKVLQQLLENCALEQFPSRNAAAIAVAPGHLRGLPTQQPMYTPREDAPFDMLAFPQLKLNEPLRVLHVSRDGAWYFVESASSSGWVETRDVAFVDQSFIDAWIKAPKLVIVRDQAAIPDGRGIATSLVKLGTVLPLSGQGDRHWTVTVASAADGGKAVARPVQIPSDAAAPFPLAFDSQNVAMVGDQLLGQPYGWGELYGLRDCSALLRDFFMPFGVWLPRTSGDQIASTEHPERFNHATAQEKEALIKSKGVPFLTLLYKPGHIMLYAGMDRDGQPLVFHASWSVRVKNGETKTLITGVSALTTLNLGQEQGLEPGWSLLEKITQMGTITGRCR
ncbi:MAG TPA: SH3 domain-containing protein [Geomonas sp.]|nr:SH3 domain-containing protein [Geomonas sp.]